MHLTFNDAESCANDLYHRLLRLPLFYLLQENLYDRGVPVWLPAWNINRTSSSVVGQHILNKEWKNNYDSQNLCVTLFWCFFPYSIILLCFLAVFTFIIIVIGWFCFIFISVLLLQERSIFIDVKWNCLPSVCLAGESEEL